MKWLFIVVSDIFVYCQIFIIHLFFRLFIFGNCRAGQTLQGDGPNEPLEGRLNLV